MSASGRAVEKLKLVHDLSICPFEIASDERDAMKDTIAYAKLYIQHGFALLPVKGKEPNFEALQRCNGDARWARYRTEKATIEQVADWVEADPETGIAVITGSASRLVVADYDSGSAPDLGTATVRTARGYHLYLQHNGVMPKKKTVFGDLQAERAYVVAPPSPTTTGGTYSWVPDRGLDEVGLMSYEAAASLFEASTPTIPIGVNIFTPRGNETKSQPWASLADWDKDDDFIRAVCDRIGIPHRSIGRTFRCVLPGHEETRPSASLTTDKNGAIVYHDWHAKDGRQFYVLAEVYAAVISGTVTRLNAPELSRWKLRMLIETEAVTAPPIILPPLRSANATQTKVYDGLRLLIQSRALAEDTDPFPFTASFVSRWCRISEDQAKTAIRFIRDEGLLVIAGQFQSGRHAGHLYLPASARASTTSMRLPPPRTLIDHAHTDYAT
jgi:Bifunctional DNA primase/polymerase, N-terminal